MPKQSGSVFSVDVAGLDAGDDQPAYVRISERIRAAIASAISTAASDRP